MKKVKLEIVGNYDTQFGELLAGDLFLCSGGLWIKTTGFTAVDSNCRSISDSSKGLLYAEDKVVKVDRDKVNIRIDFGS